MKFFFHALVKSIYDFRFISDARKEGKRAWGYAIMFVFLSSLIFSIPLVNFVFNGFDSMKQYVRQELVDFTAQVENGEIKVTGISQPFERRFEEGKDKVRVIVDTVTTNTLAMEEEIKKDDSVYTFLVHKEAFVGFDGATKDFQRVSFKEMPNYTISDKTIISNVEKVQSFRFAITALILALVYVGSLVGKLIYLLFVALVVYIVASIAKKDVKFGEIYIMGLFAITLPTLVINTLVALNGNFFFLYTAILLGMLFGAVWSKDKTAPTPEPPTANPS